MGGSCGMRTIFRQSGEGGNRRNAELRAGHRCRGHRMEWKHRIPEDHPSLGKRLGKDARPRYNLPLPPKIVLFMFHVFGQGVGSEMQLHTDAAATGLVPRLSQKHAGAYYTPNGVAAALVAWTVREAGDRLLDPACGDGQFLACHSHATGIEQDPVAARQAQARAPTARIQVEDFFAWATETTERFEGAAGNPPFIRYQTFKGEIRKRALTLCARQGVVFSGLASSWAPFLVATAGLLKPGARMAFVVPAEIGHAPYAAPLLEYLVGSFSEVRIVAIRDKIFPTLSEDCWLLYADGYGGRTDRIGLTITDLFVPSRAPPPTTLSIDVAEWRSIWNRRLRPYLLPTDARDLYAAALGHHDSQRLSDFAAIGIGYVSGDNEFFHLRPSDAARWDIPAACLHPSVRSARSLPERRITRSTVDGWKSDDAPVMLLRLRRGQELPAGVRRYLDSSAGQQARLGYKCRNREPWYAVPDVQVPDYVMSYMSGRSVSLVRNDAEVTCTNSVHALRVHDAAMATKLLPEWSSPFVRLSCELEGHALGGGMLKLEPREAARILFPAPDIARRARADILEEAIVRMQNWRHYG